MKLPVVALAAIAGIAHASPYLTSANGPQTSDPSLNPILGYTITLDLSGVNSWDLQGDTSNELLPVFQPMFNWVIGISWDVTIVTVDASWLSEAVIGFEDELFLTPGIGNDFAGTMSFSSGGMIDLIGDGLDFFYSPDGFLDIEFFESFDDVDDEIDAFYAAGSTVQVQLAYPAPGSLALLGFAGIAASRRRR
jgi:hypothetical protein